MNALKITHAGKKQTKYYEECLFLGNTGVAMTDYTYSSPYTQYTATYPPYGYGTGSLLSK